MQERRNSSVLAMQLRLSCTDPLVFPMGLNDIRLRDILQEMRKVPVTAMDITRLK